MTDTVYHTQLVTRRAIATKLHDAWKETDLAEHADRLERLETIMSAQDYENACRNLTPPERDRLRDVLNNTPAWVRATLDTQQYRLRGNTYAQVIADHRRRINEVRCWIIDAIEAFDQLDFREARRLCIDAAHQLDFLLTKQAQNPHRPSQTQFETNPLLRERTERVRDELRRCAVALRAVM